MTIFPIVRQYIVRGLGIILSNSKIVATTLLSTFSLGVEVGVSDGRNYHFEYRIGQAGQIGDMEYAPDASALGTDISELPDPSVVSRPNILLLAKHALP